MRWQADAPAGLAIVGAFTSSMTVAGLNAGSDDFGGGFYWSGGGPQTRDGQTQAWVGSFASSYFGFQMICGKAACTQPAQFDIGALTLVVHENSGLGFGAPSGLWQSTGWVRGNWPFFAWSNSPSGVCSLSATLNGELINTSTASPDVSSWHQCTESPIQQTVDTSRFGQGAVPLTLSASDAAGMSATTTKTLYVDNQTPAVAVAGPSDSPSTAGVQYFTATSTAGPAGVDGLSCALAGAPAHWYPGSTARVPVTGVGEHSVSCTALSNAVDGNGGHGASAPASAAMKIGQPSLMGIGFTRLVDALRCARVQVPVRVPAHWVTVRRDHRLVRVRRRAHVVVTRITRCHPRIAQRQIKVWKTIIRHGRKVRVERVKRIRVVLLPHHVARTVLHVNHGHGVTVNGWLGTGTAAALGGQTVDVLTAPDNGQGAFVVSAVTTTAGDGGWSARLPAGPSRLIEASYAGGPATEAAISAPVIAIVPAEVKLLRVTPARIPWGGTVRLTGQLVGGYLPPGGALVRLRIGLGSSFTTYGVHTHVVGDGRFSTSYTFGAGQPSVHRRFWFQLASLPIGSYPYAPAASRRLPVTVGGPPRLRR